MSSIAQLSTEKPVPQFSNQQVADILEYLSVTTSNEQLNDNSSIGLSILLKSLSVSIAAEC
ncbi:hypothetical protein CTM97_18915 [Photobacterium phosphoreum]|uniref:Uncharacterized protein n=1 Tax=Photobacterium phosphoreum TaxID=659 RepID=A0A2T3JQ14_PHOPO|nr:hypothetical protein [Photobacterium phosphoreum]PSU24726.1 hypothetical protein CTM96_12370 [Photobacterium phosphoreum]PSU38590.1 hypothetical protein CTM97_18915 [Photobacterium phosphoreum]PSU51100.1 hypothetical protein C9J18_12960 [Photobacterium phosphoreum]